MKLSCSRIHTNMFLSALMPMNCGCLINFQSPHFQRFVVYFFDFCCHLNCSCLRPVSKFISPSQFCCLHGQVPSYCLEGTVFWWRIHYLDYWSSFFIKYLCPSTWLLICVGRIGCFDAQVYTQSKELDGTCTVLSLLLHLCKNICCLLLGAVRVVGMSMRLSFMYSYLGRESFARRLYSW